MSRAPSMAVAAAALDRLLAACRKGTTKPVYVLVGDNADTRRGAEALVDALVPAERRSFNLEVHDGRSTPIVNVLASARTPAFFPGIKLLWVRESPVFLSGAKKADVAKAMLAAWEAGRKKEAAEKLATLAALAGWTPSQFAEADWKAVKKTALRELFGDEVGPDHGEQLQAMHEAALAAGIDLRDFRDDAAVLADYLDATPPPDAVLVFTVAAIDGRKRLVKRVQEIGAVVEFTVERERSGALGRDGVLALARERAEAAGKRLDAAALEEIVRRAGHDAAAFAQELEKLVLYVGDRARIAPSDVRAVLLDRAESWIFDFTGGLAARDIDKALPVLRGLLAQGEPPLRILALVAREVRLLLIARESIDSLPASIWRPGLTYATFQSRVLPAIDVATKEAFGKVHPFALFRRFEDAARIPAVSLRRALLELARLDSRFKSSAGDAGVLLESFVVDFCR